MIIKVMSPIPNGSSVGGACMPTTTLTKAATTIMTAPTETSALVAAKQKEMQFANGEASTIALTITTATTTTTSSTSTISQAVVMTLAPAITTTTKTTTTTEPTKTVDKSSIVTAATAHKDNKNASELCKNANSNKDKLEMLMQTPLTDKKSNAKCNLKQDSPFASTVLSTATTATTTMAKATTAATNAAQSTQKYSTTATTTITTTTNTEAANSASTPTANRTIKATTAAATTTNNSNQIKSENNGATEVANGNGNVVKHNGMQSLKQQQSQQNVPPTTIANTNNNNSSNSSRCSSVVAISTHSAIEANKQMLKQQQQQHNKAQNSRAPTTATTTAAATTTTKTNGSLVKCDNVAKSINNIKTNNNNNTTKSNNNKSNNTNNNNNRNKSNENDSNTIVASKQKIPTNRITTAATTTTTTASIKSTMTITETETIDVNNIKHECDQAVEIKREEDTLGSNDLHHTNAQNIPASDNATETSTTSTATHAGNSNEELPVGTAKQLTDTNGNDNLILAKRRPVLLSLVNPHIMCNLCHGYLIDATTIVECLHSFCHSCLIKHLRTENYCPRCEMMINTAKPNIKPDTTLQAIVYKLVPGLYERELMRKRAFYKDRPEEAALATPEQRGDDTEHLIFSPSDYMSLSLEYADLDQLMGGNQEYGELLKPRYLQCPAMYTVGHLKKFVYGKFEIDTQRFNIDIMYKVKTIVLLDHYTLMDVAYIYTWKRDAPMRFYFRVKESLRPIRPARKFLLPLKTEGDSSYPQLPSNAMTVVHNPTPTHTTNRPNSNDVPMLLQPNEIKVENDEEQHKDARFEIVANSVAFGKRDELSTTDPLKITIVNKNSKDTKHAHAHSTGHFHSETKPSTPSSKPNKEKKEGISSSITPPERKVENIKLKIDLSKQNSVTIINMSDPERKQIVKPVRPDKEWKVKSKRQDKESGASPKSNGERKSKSPSPLTVPPLTIKAGRVSPLTKTQADSSKPPTTTEDIKKSDFLKSFALEPIKSKSASPEKLSTTTGISNNKKLPTNLGIPTKATATSDEKLLMKPPIGVAPKAAVASKRKSKEPVKAIAKKPKLSTGAIPPLAGPATDAFKIKIPVSNKTASDVTTAPSGVVKNVTDKPHMPPPAPITAMRPPRILLPKKPQKPNAKYVSAPGSLTPHPMHAPSMQLATPGNRTPITNRYQPILPKAARPNPFANIPSDVNKILKDAGTEIKSIQSNDNNNSKVYGPKQSIMGPPPTLPQPVQHAAQSTNNTVASSPSSATALNNAGNVKTTTAGNTANLQRNQSGAGQHKQNIQSNNNNSNKTNNYLNLALFNSSKSKGNEVPPGCRTPMYTPNSPIYSPSSPQYAPNYTIPTMPSYKYTPKPSNASNYLQNVLGSTSSQLASLFPSPPTRKESAQSTANNSSSNNNNSNNNNASKNDNAQAAKRVYPFARSPSPSEDPPEKQLKVKSLLTSCNINIPSSLSITITREDAESQSNNSSYPKHKSPVNNYIEILKLPEQPVENETTKRASPPMSKPAPLASSTHSQLTGIRKDMSELKPIPSPQHLIARISQAMAQQQQQHQNNKPAQPNTMNNHNNNNKNNSNQGTNNGNGKQNLMGAHGSATNGGMPSPKANNATVNGLSQLQQQLNKSPQGNAMVKAQNPVTKTVPSPTSGDKKTPSPEKRSSPLSNSNSAQTSPNSSENKSPSNSADGTQASKKFRHILPRQNTSNTPEVVPPTLSNSNIIGTYASPSGVAVKIHSKKKVPVPNKKSPNNSFGAPAVKQTLNGSGVLTPQGSPNHMATTATTQTTAATTAKSISSPKTSPLATTTINANNQNNHNNYNNNNNSSSSGKSTQKQNAVATSMPTTGNSLSLPSTTAPALSSPNALNKLLPHNALAAAAAAAATANGNSSATSLPTHLPHPIQMMGGLPNLSPHLGLTTPANQAELNKFLKDNLLRAQVQAAANQPNMFYSAYAAQMSQYAPSMYNYQQAYLMEQFSRIQRAGTEAFTEYMQKLKNGMDATNTNNNNNNNSSTNNANSKGITAAALSPKEANENQKTTPPSTTTSPTTISLSVASPKQQSTNAEPKPNNATTPKAK